MRCVADVASTHQFAAYTQYVCSAKVAADSGRCTSHILMVSSQDPLKNRLRCVIFQLSEYTYSAEGTADAVHAQFDLLDNHCGMPWKRYTCNLNRAY